MPSSTQNSKKHRNRQLLKKLKLANIVQGLAFHQQLSASQSLILKITPLWHDWCEQQRSTRGSKHFSAAADTTLSSFEKGVLTLSCHNSSTATVLKHQKDSLLTALHKAEFNDVKRIQIKMALTSTAANKPTTVLSDHAENRQQPSSSSIKSVEAVQRRIKNEHLANSLKRLARTLKKQ